MASRFIMMLRHMCFRLQVRTYDVVPVSSSLGLVEFVPGTQPLKNAIMAFIEPEVCLKPSVHKHFHACCSILLPV